MWAKETKNVSNGYLVDILFTVSSILSFNISHTEATMQFNSLHVARNYARKFLHGHYLLLEENSFPGAALSKNCSFLVTDNVRGQIT